MRFLSIDLLRAIAIILMVLVHFAENLSGGSGYNLLPGQFAAPIFTFLVGASYRLWLDAQEKRGISEDEISKQTIRRGLFLMGLGFAFNIFVWLPEETFNWDVLTAIGASFFVLNLARKVPSAVSIAACLLVFVVSPVLRKVAHYPAFWTNGYFENDLSFSGVMLGFLCTGYFPMLPWIIFPLAGYVAATYVFAEPAQSPASAKLLALFGASLMCTAAAVLLLSAYFPSETRRHLEGWSMFPATFPYVVGSLGVTILAMSLAHLWIDSNPRISKDGRFAMVVGTYSRHSLSIYVLHHVVHLWPLWLYAVRKGLEPTYYWREAMPEGTATVLAVAFIVLCYPLFRWIDRRGKPDIESFMRWVCA